MDRQEAKAGEGAVSIWVPDVAVSLLMIFLQGCEYFPQDAIGSLGYR